MHIHTRSPASTHGPRVEGDGASGSNQAADAGPTYRVQPGDTFANLAVKLYGELLPNEAPVRLVAAFARDLVERGQVEAGTPLSKYEGAELQLNPHFVARYQQRCKLGMLPDGKAGHTSQKIRDNAGRLMGTQEPPLPALEAIPKGPRAKGAKAGAGLQHPPLQPIPQNDPTLEAIPKAGRHSLGGHLRARGFGKLADRVDADLGRACVKAGVPREAYQQLEAFCDQHGLSTTPLKLIATSGKYQGPELAEALKTYATVIHALKNDLLAKDTAQGMATHVLPKILAGKLRFAVENPEQNRSLGASHAIYNHTNNTITLREPGLDLSSTHGRGVLLHEAQHVVQDARKDTNHRVNFEEEAHGVFADYMLRSAGAIRVVDGELHVDHDRYQEVLNHRRQEGELERVWDRPDRHAMEAVFARAWKQVEQAGHRERLHPAALREESELWRALAPQESFLQMYRDHAVTSPLYAGLSPTQLHSRLFDSYTKHGLD